MSDLILIKQSNNKHNPEVPSSRKKERIYCERILFAHTVVSVKNEKLPRKLQKLLYHLCRLQQKQCVQTYTLSRSLHVTVLRDVPAVSFFVD